MNIRNLVGIALLAVVSMTLIAVAQDTAPKADSGLIQVNVSVTEPRGRAVVGFTKDDFQIFENSTAQQIVSFSEGSVSGDYVLTYKSANNAQDGTFRNLRVQITPARGPNIELTVRTRAGYVAPAAGK